MPVVRMTHQHASEAAASAWEVCEFLRQQKTSVEELARDHSGGDWSLPTAMGEAHVGPGAGAGGGERGELLD